METIKIKPLSVNEAWQGRRYKTKAYKDYENFLLLVLPKLDIPKNKDLSLFLTFGISRAFDWDNSIKPFVDILQKKYGFNDNRIMKAIVFKKIVKKGQEFIQFNLKEFQPKKERKSGSQNE